MPILWIAQNPFSNRQKKFIYTNLRLDVVLYQRNCYNGEPYNDYAIIAGIRFSQSSALYIASVVRNIKKNHPKTSFGDILGHNFTKTLHILQDRVSKTLWTGREVAWQANISVTFLCHLMNIYAVKLFLLQVTKCRNASEKPENESPTLFY